MTKRQRTNEDSLAEAFPEATVQQQFMLCIQDQLSVLEQRLGDFEKATFIPKHLVASGCSVAKTFIIRCHVLQNEESRSFAERLLMNLACETAEVTMCRHDSSAGEDKSTLELVLEMPHSMTSLSIGQIIDVVSEQPGSKLEVHGLDNNDRFLSDEILRCQHADKESPCHYVWQESKLQCEHVPVPAMTTDLINLDFCLRHPASITSRVVDMMHHMNA